jgi:hypothetical protein
MKAEALAVMKNIEVTQRPKLRLRWRAGQAHDLGEGQRQKNDEGDAAADLREGFGRGAAEHEREEKREEGGDDDVGEEEGGDDEIDAALEEADDDGGGDGGGRDAAEEGAEGDLAARAESERGAPGGEAHAEVGGEQHEVRAAERVAGEARLEKDEEEHAHHEPADEKRADVGLRQQRAQNDRGEDGACAREAGHGEKSGRGKTGRRGDAIAAWQSTARAPGRVGGAARPAGHRGGGEGGRR